MSIKHTQHMLYEYYPNTLSKYNISKSCDVCPQCNNNLNVRLQYIFDKRYKDECDVCAHSDLVEGIYCLCSSDNFYQKMMFVSCDCCADNDRIVDSHQQILPKPHKTNKHSYKELYMLAKNKNIRKRSFMTKEELYELLKECLL